MQSITTPDYLLDHMPFFGDESVAVPDLPLARNAIELPLVPAALETVAVLKALRIVRAKTGETEMRLFSQNTDDGGTAYVIRSTTLHPYKHDDKVLAKNGKPMTEEQARASFERMVVARYPAVVLRKNVSVSVHLDLL